MGTNWGEVEIEAKIKSCLLPFKGKGAAKRTILLYSLLTIGAMALFPPWKQTLQWKGTRKENPSGYHFIVLPPTPTSGSFGVEIDYPRLLLQWAAVISLAAGASVFASKPQEEGG